jgi:hypothetical protein
MVGKHQVPGRAVDGPFELVLRIDPGDSHSEALALKEPPQELGELRLVLDAEYPKLLSGRALDRPFGQRRGLMEKSSVRLGACESCSCRNRTHPVARDTEEPGKTLRRLVRMQVASVRNGPQRPVPR